MSWREYFIYFNVRLCTGQYSCFQSIWFFDLDQIPTKLVTNESKKKYMCMFSTMCTYTYINTNIMVSNDFENTYLNVLTYFFATVILNLSAMDWGESCWCFVMIGLYFTTNNSLLVLLFLFLLYLIDTDSGSTHTLVNL